MKLYKQIAIAVALSITAAAFLSYSMWGYPFFRPDIPSAVRSVSDVKSIGVFSNWRPENSGILQRDGDWQGRLSLSKSHPYDIPEGRALVVWQELNFLKSDVSEFPLEMADQILGAVTSFFPVGNEAYKTTATNRSAVIALFDGELGEDLIFVAVRAGQHRNDHFAYREFVLKREENSYRVLERSSFQFEVAGIEGLEFPLLFVIFFLLLMLIRGSLKLVWFIVFKALKIQKT